MAIQVKAQNLKAIEGSLKTNGNLPETDWQLLGELRPPASSNINEALAAWLTKTISPLSLQDGFANKLLRSSQEATANKASEQIHIVVFVRQRQFDRSQNWGFFRLERTEKAPGSSEQHPEHTIEFYLYPEN